MRVTFEAYYGDVLEYCLTLRDEHFICNKALAVRHSRFPMAEVISLCHVLAARHTTRPRTFIFTFSFFVGRIASF